MHSGVGGVTDRRRVDEFSLCGELYTSPGLRRPAFDKTQNIKVTATAPCMPRVVIVGSGIAGIYLAHLLADAFEVVVVDPQDRHQFIIGVPMAMAGMVDFEQLLFPFTSMKKVQFVQSKAIGVEDRCVRIADGNSPRVCGRYLVLAPGALRIGSAEYWNVKGAQAIYEAVKKAPAVRFIVNEYNPVMGFQEIAYAIKARHPEKAVSVHVVYVSPDYQNVLSLWARWAREVGIEVSDEPPEYKPGELHISVPGVRPHPLVSTLKINPLTFEAGPACL